MTDLPLNVPAGVLVKTSLVDYPGHVAGSFFLKGCNIRCPYCYNIGLVLDTEDEEGLSTVEELLDHLEKRRRVLTGLVISGGEPLLNPYTPVIIRRARQLGYSIKLDTNGTLPDRLEQLLESEELRPDFMAMDIKTSPEKYPELLLGACRTPSDTSRQYFARTLKKSAELVSTLPPGSREFRTVLVPTLVAKEDIKAMSQLIPADASWQFAQFRNDNCLDKSYCSLQPYTDSELGELVDYARSLIPGAALR